MPWLLPARSKVFPRPLDWEFRFRGACSQELRAARYSRSGQRGTGAHPALVGKAFADTQQMQVSASNKLACATHSAPQVPAMCALQGHLQRACDVCVGSRSTRNIRTKRCRRGRCDIRTANPARAHSRERERCSSASTQSASTHNGIADSAKTRCNKRAPRLQLLLPLPMAYPWPIPI